MAATITEVRMYRRGESGQVARALRILHALRGYPEGRTLEQLADLVGVHVRTVKRDLAELGDAHIQIDRTPIDRRAAARLEDEGTRTVVITRRERYTLLAIRRVFDVFKGTPFADDVESLLAKRCSSARPQRSAPSWPPTVIASRTSPTAAPRRTAARRT